MTATTIHDQPVTDERAATTSALDPRPTVTGPTTSARTFAWIAGGVAVVAVLSALAAAGYRAYVGSDQPATAVSATTVTASSTRWDADGADAGPRSPHGVTAAHAGIVAGIAAAQRSLVDGAPPQRGASETAAITAAPSLTVSASGSIQPLAAPMVHGGRVGLPQSRGTLIDG